MTNVQVIPTNSSRVRARIRTISNNLKSMEIPNKKISIMLDRWVHDNFKTEGGKVGGWKKLKAGGRYKKVRSDKRFTKNIKGGLRGRTLDTSAKILKDTRRLEISFIPFSSKKNAGIGSKLPYAKTHEEGISPVPMRRILPKIQEIESDIIKRYEDHIERATR